MSSNKRTIFFAIQKGVLNKHPVVLAGKRFAPPFKAYKTGTADISSAVPVFEHITNEYAKPYAEASPTGK